MVLDSSFSTNSATSLSWAGVNVTSGVFGGLMLGVELVTAVVSMNVLAAMRPADASATAKDD